MRRAALALGLIWTCLLLLGTDALAESHQGPALVGAGDSAVMLVVDTSDSMAEDGGSGKSTKMDGARQALIDFVRAIPATTTVGLRAYPGSGTSSDASGCSVGDAVVPLAAGNLSTVDARIRQLEAAGNTPTGPALQRAANDLKASNKTQATIVLVSDGESNCGPDPCEVAAQIAAGGIDITVNTVGFQISAAGKQQLECISAKTDGLYADADNNAQLSAQLDQFTRPLLDVTLDHPSTAKAAVGSDDQGLVSVTATITNVGSVPATDAQVTFAFDGTTAPTVLSPRRRLGNLPSGATVEARWQFRPPLLERDTTLAFRVTSRARNSTALVVNGSMALTAGVSLDDAGPILKNAKHIAILGDSYSAGEGAGTYIEGTATLTNGCHRSRKTYAVPMWDAKTADGYRADVWACSGAESPELENDNPDNPVGPQIDHLMGQESYDAVLMTMGGNDIGFATIAKTCVVLPADCTRVYSGKPAEARNLWQTLVQDYRTVEGSLNRKQNVQKRGRPAPLIVLSYPNPFPLASRNSCSRAYSTGEQRLFQSIVDGLSEAAARAAAVLQEEGLPVFFVPDSVDAFQPDHTYCSSDPYIVRLRTGTNVDNVSSPTTGPGQYVTPLGLAYRTRILKSSVLDAEKLRLITAAQEQIHPTAAGYRAMTYELVRWSTTPVARVPITRKDPWLQVVSNPSPDATVKISPEGSTGAVVQPGGVVVIQGGGLPPGGEAELQVRSEPVPLALRLIDEEGRVSFKVRIPSTLPVGRHALVVRVSTADDSASFAAPLEVRRDRPWWLLPLGAGGSLSAGAGALLWRRSRRL